MSTTCRSCGAPIFWATTDKGKAMPVDIDPHVDGNLAVVLKPDGTRRVKVTSPLLAGPTERYISHFATCPNAKEHRKR